VNDILASLAFLLIVVGWTQRRNRARHVPLVLSGIGLDLVLVVWLELSRGVVEKTMHDHFSMLRWVHIWSSTLAVVFYVPTLVYGFRLIKGTGGPETRKRHALVATIALVLRTIGFFCMWGVEAAK
jgi:uncharacterized membrane protein YozB (DUF420 family)